jgi:hypothetical protein
MEIMLSEIQQKDVWDGWLGSEARSLYFAELCNRYSRVQRRITWGLLAASSGATATVLTGLPDWFRFLLPLATAGLSLWSLVENNSKTATDCSDVHFRWSKLATEYKALWDDMYSTDAQKRLSDLLLKEAEISKTCNPLPNRTEDLRKWQRYVVEQHGLTAII